jgi:hypothetical protein
MGVARREGKVSTILCMLVCGWPKALGATAARFVAMGPPRWGEPIQARRVSRRYVCSASEMSVVSSEPC